MIKLKFFRASAPIAPLRVTAPHDDARRARAEPFCGTGASAAEQRIWRTTLDWMMGDNQNVPQESSPRVDKSFQAHAAALHDCVLDTERLGAAHALGHLARNGSCEALSVMSDALTNGTTDLVRHAAMHGLAVAADAAVPCLQTVVEAGIAALTPICRDSANAEVSAAWCHIVRGIWALGEGTRCAPFDATIEILGCALATTLTMLRVRQPKCLGCELLIRPC